MDMIILLVICLVTVTVSSRRKMKLSQLRGSDVNIGASCSFNRSSLIHDVLKTDFYRVYASHDVVMPKTCVLHTTRNPFAVLEEAKLVLGAHHKCELCGKLFYTPQHLNNHMMSKHRKFVAMGADKFCLADLCDVFRCELREQAPVVRQPGRSCDPKLVRITQRKCENLLNSCLPNSSDHLLYDELYESTCSTLTCEKFFEPFEDISVTYILFLVLGVPVIGIILIFLCYAVYDELNGIGNADASLDETTESRDISYAYNHQRRITASVMRRRATAVPDRLKRSPAIAQPSRTIARDGASARSRGSANHFTINIPEQQATTSSPVNRAGYLMPL